MNTAIATEITAGAAARAQRADARRNRQRVLEAAVEVFTAEGADVHMDAIARKAGVGIGTLYRHFPTKQALVLAIAQQWLDEATEIATKALRLADPVAGLRHLLRSNAGWMARNVGLRDLFNDYPDGKVCPFEELDQSELNSRIEDLLRRARAAGVVRADLRLPEFQALMCGMAVAIDRGAPWRRCADILVAGLQAV